MNGLQDLTATQLNAVAAILNIPWRASEHVGSESALAGLGTETLQLIGPAIHDSLTAVQALRAAVPALSEAQALTTTGFGLRRCIGCKPEDTVANKFAAGALSVVGIENMFGL